MFKEKRIGVGKDAFHFRLLHLAEAIFDLLSFVEGGGWQKTTSTLLLTSTTSTRKPQPPTLIIGTLLIPFPLPPPPTPPPPIPPSPPPKPMAASSSWPVPPPSPSRLPPRNPTTNRHPIRSTTPRTAPNRHRTRSRSALSVELAPLPRSPLSLLSTTIPKTCPLRSPRSTSSCHRTSGPGSCPGRRHHLGRACFGPSLAVVMRGWEGVGRMRGSWPAGVGPVPVDGTLTSLVVCSSFFVYSSIVLCWGLSFCGGRHHQHRWQYGSILLFTWTVYLWLDCYFCDCAFWIRILLGFSEFGCVICLEKVIRRKMKSVSP